ncbi:MAG: Lrp/AsnC ligand binding domain-containing protein [Promethearchaeota archaeon]
MLREKEQKKAQRFIKALNTNKKIVITKQIEILNYTRQTFYKKFENLIEQKIISNFTINIDPNIRPNNLKYVMIEIKTNPKEPELVEELLKIPQLRMLDGIFGDFSLFALFVFKSPEEYYQILNSIDNIMAKSYFKKYQIIETIKVFKTNGISLRNSKISFDIGRKINLKEISKNSANIEYNPQKFPGLVLKIEDPRATILIFSTGKIIVTNFSKNVEAGQKLDKIIEEIRKIGIRLEMKKIDQNLNIDELDYLILKILQEEQGLRPISTYEIKDLLNEKYSMTLKALNKDDISQSTIHNRIKRLERQGVILNYTVNFNPKKIGFKGKYLLRIKPKDPSKYNELAIRLDTNKNITDLFRIGEQYGLFAIIRVRKVGDYANLIRELYETEEIEDTFTNFVLDELIPYTNFVF